MAILQCQDLVERLRLAQPVPHVPRFRVTCEGIYWTVFDGEAPIAVVVRDTGTGGAMLDVLKFRPTDEGRSATPPPYNYHYTTRLGYGASFNWSMDSMFQSPDVDALELVEETAERLTFLHTGEYTDGSRMSARLEIGYDPAIGQYGYDLTWDIAGTRDVVGEFCNVYHATLSHSDMAVREYDYGCFVREGGQWEKYPITILVTGPQQWRLLGVPLALGGGAGHINRNGIVPMIVHRRANVPLFMGSCTTCFDLHQSAQVRAGQPAHIESRFVDVGPLVAVHPAELQPLAIDGLQAYTFHPEQVCDFSQVIHAAAPWSGGIWLEGNGVAISEEQAHHGARSLALTASATTPVSTYPYGPALAFDNHTEYEASVWVKVAGDEKVEAGIVLNAFLYSANNPQCLGTATVVGPHDWTHLLVRVNSGIADNGYVSLKLTGEGRAWFDEIVVRKVGGKE